MDFNRTFFAPKAKGVTNPATNTVTVKIDADTQYVYCDHTTLAVNLALATSRPLLIAGPPGSGKTTLARNAAHVLGWRFYSTVVTSRTQARDLQWQFDTLRRLNDAQDTKQPLLPRPAYIRPEVFWWSFNRDTAAECGAEQDELKQLAAIPAYKPPTDPQADVKSSESVVLVDEIDKAEPDVPNDLLETLDVGKFTVTDLDSKPVVERTSNVLLMITTNGERELPPAFLRRCVLLTLPKVNKEWLVNIANERFGAEHQEDHEQVADVVVRLGKRAEELGVRQPSTAEYIDAVRARSELGLKTGNNEAWNKTVEALLWKREDPLPGA